jgi:hypothetical protein
MPEADFTAQCFSKLSRLNPAVYLRINLTLDEWQPMLFQTVCRRYFVAAVASPLP